MGIIFVIAVIYKFFREPIYNSKTKSYLLLVITIFTMMIGLTLISFVFLIIFILTLELNEKD